MARATPPPSPRKTTSGARINGYGYCVDAHAKELTAAGEPAVRINLVAAWRESTVYAETEQAQDRSVRAGALFSVR